MKIQGTHMTTSTQVHTGKCYLIGMASEYDCAANDVEVSTSAAAANQRMQTRGDAGVSVVILPKPGIECSNGLYVVAAGRCTVYWSLG